MTNPDDSPGAAAAGGPVGSGDYVVQAGECVASIAFDHGFFWETLWNHPGNADLKAARGSPNVLLEGDRMTIPDLKIKQAPAGTGARSRFKVKGVPAKLKLRVTAEVPAEPPPAAGGPAASAGPSGLLGAVGSAVSSAVAAITGSAPGANPNATYDPEPAPPPVRKPRANVPYLLDIDGTVTRGQTDGDGYVECDIPPNAKHGKLTLDPGTLDACAMTLNLGHLNPLAQVSGVKQRLANLGYDCGDRSDETTDNLTAALLAFQADHGLAASGDVDGATRSKLKDLHGS